MAMTAAELYKKYHEEFLRERTRQEMEVLSFAENMKHIDPKVFKGKVEIPENLTLKSLIPELYEEEPCKEVYEEQYNKAEEFFSKVNSIIKEVNEEAYKCLSEYQVIASGQ